MDYSSWGCKESDLVSNTFTLGVLVPQGGEVHSMEESESSSKSGSEFTSCMTFGKLLTLSEPLFFLGFPGDSVVKNSPANAGDIEDVGSILGSGRSPGGGNSNPPQYFCLENPMDRGAWVGRVHGVTKSQT